MTDHEKYVADLISNVSALESEVERLRDAMIKRAIDVEISLTAKELAEAFANGDSKYQAEFFNELSIVVETWEHGSGSFVMQLKYVTDNPALTLGGLEVMRMIGDYAEKAA